MAYSVGFFLADRIVFLPEYVIVSLEFDMADRRVHGAEAEAEKVAKIFGTEATN